VTKVRTLRRNPEEDGSPPVVACIAMAFRPEHRYSVVATSTTEIATEPRCLRTGDVHASGDTCALQHEKTSTPGGKKSLGCPGGHPPSFKAVTRSTRSRGSGWSISAGRPAEPGTRRALSCIHVEARRTALSRRSEPHEVHRRVIATGKHSPPTEGGRRSRGLNPAALSSGGCICLDDGRIPGPLVSMTAASNTNATTSAALPLSASRRASLLASVRALTRTLATVSGATVT
jgi:hypothetical protein